MIKKREKKADKKPRSQKSTVSGQKALKELIDETIETALKDEDIRKELMGEKHHGSIVTEENCCDEHDHTHAEFSQKNTHSKAKQDHSEPPHKTSIATIPKPDDFKPRMNKEEYLEILNQVIDPEVGIGIVDMGLIYDVEEDAEGIVKVTMTLTSMGCPAGPQLTTDIDGVLRLQDHIQDVQITIVWEPAWTPDRVNPKVKEMLWGY